MLHKKIILGDIHKIHNWEFANEADRLAFAGYTNEDVGKVAWQRDNDSFWFLKAASPIAFIQFGGSDFNSGVLDASTSVATLGLLPTSGVIYGATVVVKTPFNDPAATMSIGTIAEPTSIVPSDSVNMQLAGTYVIHPAFFNNTNQKEIQAFINSGTSTDGEVFIKLSIG